jgi:hypothetical protein
LPTPLSPRISTVVSVGATRAEQVEHLAHLGRVADDRARRLLEDVGLRVIGERQPTLLERLLEHGLELGEAVVVLVEEVVRALLHGADRLVHRAMAGQHDDLRARRALADVGQQVQTGAVGHAQVEQHERVLTRAQELAGLGQIAGLFDPVADAGEFQDMGAAELGIVIHEQDAALLLRHGRLQRSRWGASA